MKISRTFMTTLVASIMAACSNDNDWVDQLSNPDVIVPDAYASFSISIPHISRTRAASTDPEIVVESTVKSLHVLIYDTESPNMPTVAESMVAGGTLAQKPARNSTWIAGQSIGTKKTDKYIFVGVNLNVGIVNYITSNGLGVFSCKDFTQEITKLMSQANGFVMSNSAYPTLTPAADLYERRSKVENNHTTISVNRITAKAAVFQSQSSVVSGDGTVTDLKFSWRNLDRKFYFTQDNKDALIKDYNWANYIAEDFTRGINAINVYASADVSIFFSYATEDAFQCTSGTSDVDTATPTSVSGVLTPTNTISAKINPLTVAADFKTIVNPKPVGKAFLVVRTASGVTNYFVNGPTAGRLTELCVANALQVPSVNRAYLLSEDTYSNGLRYYHIFVNGDAVTPQVPYGIYRNQCSKININPIQAPGDPPDSFDSGEPIKPNSRIGIGIQIIPWGAIEEDHDL